MRKAFESMNLQAFLGILEMIWKNTHGIGMTKWTYNVMSV